MRFTGPLVIAMALSLLACESTPTKDSKAGEGGLFAVVQAQLRG